MKRKRCHLKTAVESGELTCSKIAKHLLIKNKLKDSHKQFLCSFGIHPQHPQCLGEILLKRDEKSSFSTILPCEKLLAMNFMRKNDACSDDFKTTNGELHEHCFENFLLHHGFSDVFAECVKHNYIHLFPLLYERGFKPNC